MNEIKKMETVQTLIAKGHHRDVVARYLRLNTTAFNAMLKRGETDVANEEDTPDAQMYKMVIAAESQAEIDALDVIMKAAKDLGDWKAAAWYLERTRKDVYSPKTELSAEHTHRVTIINDI